LIAIMFAEPDQFSIQLCMCHVVAQEATRILNSRHEHSRTFVQNDLLRFRIQPDMIPNSECK